VKTLKNGEVVPKRIYLYLIEYRYNDKESYFQKTFNEDNICDLSAKEIVQYFLHASSIDLSTMKRMEHNNGN